MYVPCLVHGVLGMDPQVWASTGPHDYVPGPSSVFSLSFPCACLDYSYWAFLAPDFPCPHTDTSCQRVYKHLPMFPWPVIHETVKKSSFP